MNGYTLHGVQDIPCVFAQPNVVYVFLYFLVWVEVCQLKLVQVQIVDDSTHLFDIIFTSILYNLEVPVPQEAHAAQEYCSL